MEEERETCFLAPVQIQEPIIPLNYFSSFTRLQRVTAWTMRFVNNCRHPHIDSTNLTVRELSNAEEYWIRVIQEDHFAADIVALKANRILSNSSSLLALRPFLDSNGLLRVGGRERESDLLYQRMHPLIIHGKHLITKLVIHSEHVRMLHAGSYDESHFWSRCLILRCQHGSQAKCSGFRPRISNGSSDSRDFILRR